MILQGIKRVTKIRQQNGVIERMNKTIMERVRSMLSNAKLPRSFLGKVIATTCYLINKGLSITTKFKILKEPWNGGMVDL